jgi:hypothetical protein
MKVSARGADGTRRHGSRRVILSARESGHAAERLAPPARRVVLWLLLVAAAAGCAPAQPPLGTLVESSGAPIPLRAGYWAQPEFQGARFRGGGLEDVSLGDIMDRGLAGVARSSFRGSAQFESQAEALASPSVDVVVVPTVDLLAMEPDPGGLGAKELTTVRIQWRVSDKAGRVLWSNMVVSQLREACVVQLCRKEFAERALREHFTAAGAEMRSFPWWQRPR